MFNQRWLSVTVALWTLQIFAVPVSPTAALQLSPQPAEVVASSLSCSDLYRIGQWGRDKSQSVGSEALDSEAFRQRALKVFLEKVDPFRLLLLDSEAKAFAASAKAHWESVLSGRSCDFFTAWFESTLPVMHARLNRLYSGLDIATLAPKHFSTSPAEPELPEYDSFAANEAELKQRYNDMVKAMSRATSQHTVQAFKKDLSTLFKQDLEQLAFGDSNLIPLELLMKGVLGAIDPYSTYFSPSEFEDFYYDLAGATSGVGVLVRKVPQGLLVLKTVEGSPARTSKALFPGDVISEIDGKKLQPMKELDAKNLLKGRENTRVAMVVRNLNPQAQERRVTITRREFSFEEARVTHKVVDAKELAMSGAASHKGRVAVFEVPSFYGRGGMGSLNGERSSAEDLRAQLEQVLAKEKNLSAVVLDLRNNPGGFLEEAVSMAGLFIGNKPVVTVMESNRKRILRDTVADPIYQGPLVVLTDNQSASAAEVLAGALQDHQRALVVGDSRTYGKGSVQKLFHLDQEFMGVLQSQSKLPRGVVKLTTSIFFSPRGHTPINGGVKADIRLRVAQAPAKSVASKVVYHPIADGATAMDETATRQLEAQRVSNLGRVAQLERRHEVRMKDITHLIDTTFKQQMGIHGAPSNAEQDLAETVAIARDYAQVVRVGERSASAKLRSDIAEAQR